MKKIFKNIQPFQFFCFDFTIHFIIFSFHGIIEVIISAIVFITLPAVSLAILDNPQLVKHFYPYDDTAMPEILYF